MTAHRLLREHGLFMGPTSGAAALVAQWVATTLPDAQVAVIMPDEGHRHAETVYNDDWLAALPGWPCKELSEPGPDHHRPAAETQWTRFLWLRRSLDDVLETPEASEVPPAVGAAGKSMKRDPARFCRAERQASSVVWKT